MSKKSEAIKEVTSCRVCNNKKLDPVFSLGLTPLANAFLKERQLTTPEPFFPLEVIFCQRCSLLQLAHIVSPNLLFKNYIYVSSTSPVFIKHFEDYARRVVDKFKIPKKSLVVDIGSNDGILLKPFKKRGMKVLGVDPAVQIAKKATNEGIETLPENFNTKTARKILKKQGAASVITANNVFAHNDNIKEITKGVKLLLRDEGVFIIEVPYLVDFIEKNLFDTIYHEHLSYFSLQPLITFFESLDMKVFDVEKVESHGGSIRVFVAKENSKYEVQSIVNQMLKTEEKLGLHELKTFIEFSNNIKRNKTNLISLLSRLKIKGRTIIGYGAPAKGNTLLNYFGIGKDILDYIVDDSPLKQGLYAPGTHIPIVSSEKIKEANPDYILILAWNFADPIMRKLTDYSLKGGKFIIPVPEPAIVEQKLTIADSVVEDDLDYIVNNIREEAKKLEGKTILISGGSGFLGSYFTKIISKLNKSVLDTPCKVLSIDNYITGTASKNFLGDVDDDNIDFIYHDVRLPMFIDQKIDYIVHAAGLASPYYYQKYPLETIESAVVGAKNLLEVARNQKIEGFLFFSSSEIYGDPDKNHVPTDENYAGNVSSVGPRACYDESKRLAETLCAVYHQKFGVPTKVVRPFNVYGPGMKPNDYRVVPTFFSKALDNKNLPVHGDGKQTRTFCYVSDAMSGFFKVLLSGEPGEIYNIGNEKPEVTMLQLADTIAKLVGNGVKSKTIDYPSSYPAGEPMRRCPDLTKARRELDYKPSINLEDGLERSILWFRSKHNL